MQEKTEREKMLSGELYLATDPELTKMHLEALRLLHAFNFSTPDALKQRQDTIIRLFDSIGADFVVNPPFYCDYGTQIQAGDRLYINYDCTILDCSRVFLGNDVLLAPKVQIYTAYHPTDPNLSEG